MCYRPCCRYIFGANTKRGEEGTAANEKVAMTAPVQMEVPQDVASETVAMTSPVRMVMGDGGSSSSEEHTYKCVTAGFAPSCYVTVRRFRSLVSRHK